MHRCFVQLFCSRVAAIADRRWRKRSRRCSGNSMRRRNNCKLRIRLWPRARRRKRRRKLPALSSGGLPSREMVEESYATSVNAFRKDLETNLKNFRLDSCTTHSVQMPTEFFPFTSELSLALISSDGKNFTTDIPVKADITGKWIFPTVAEVTQRIENAQHVASGSNSSRAAAKKEAAASGQPPPYMKVDGTFVIQWPDSHASDSRSCRAHSGAGGKSARSRRIGAAASDTSATGATATFCPTRCAACHAGGSRCENPVRHASP